MVLGLCASFYPGYAISGVILLYHHVDTGTPSITSISPKLFTRHLDILAEKGFVVLELEKLVNESLHPAKADRTGSSKQVAITFDDAYISIYTNAFPILKARNLPFTIFVATDFVSDTNPAYLSWAQLREMSEAGATIANHTRSHTHLLRHKPGESEAARQARVVGEITSARDELTWHGFESRLFAFPYGEYDLHALQTVRDLGFTGFGQQSGAVGEYSDPALLPRFPLAGSYASEDTFSEKILSLGMPAIVNQVDPLVINNLRPDLILNFPASTNTSAARLTCYAPGGIAEMIVIDEQTVRIRARTNLPVGRSRYNCTLPNSSGDGLRFHWYSQLWIRKQINGDWYPEP